MISKICSRNSTVNAISNIPVLARSLAHLERAVNFEAPFTKPTLFIKADQSDYIQDQDWSLIGSMFPHYAVAHIVESKHWFNYYQPERVLQSIKNFLVAN